MTLEATLSALAEAREGSGEVSGEALAARLGLSRAALWKRIEQLRALGVEVEATAGKGYRLAQPIDLLDAARIRTQVERDAPGLMRALDVRWSIDSTNALVAKQGPAMHGHVALAEHQSRGRGRRGRTWQSPLGANVYLSIGWRFERGAADLAGFSIAVGVAVVDALRGAGFPSVGLKWPNDLVARGRKLGGLLIEVGGEIGGPSDVVIGLGVNARMPPSVDESIGQPWIDLASLEPAVAFTRTDVAARLASTLLATAARFDREGFAHERARYDSVDALRDAPITLHLGDRAIDAVACGIDDQGLLVATVDGETRRFASGEVSVRPR